MNCFNVCVKKYSNCLENFSTCYDYRTAMMLNLYQYYDKCENICNKENNRLIFMLLTILFYNL